MTGTGMILTPEQMHKLKYLCDVSVPLLSTDWQGTAAPYTIQVDWPGMTDRDMPEIWLVPSGDTPTDAELAAAALITPSTQNGHLLFSASAKPATSITARVTGVPISGEFTAANMASLVAKVDQLNTGLTGISNPNLVLLHDITSMSLNNTYTVDWDGYDEVWIVAVLRYSTATNFAHCIHRISKNEWALMSSFTKLCDNVAPALPFIIAGGNGAYANLGVYFRSPTTFSVNGAGSTYVSSGVKVYKLIK